MPTYEPDQNLREIYMARAKQEFTSTEIAAIASRGVRVPSSLTLAEIKAVCGSALTQARPKGFRWPWGKR